MTRRVAWLVALLAWLPLQAAAELQVSVEPRVVDELDTARLTIRATGSNQTQPLDLDALDEDFEVLTTQSASQYRSINGQVESWVEYQILLRPRRTGELTIPSIDVGGESTQAITLEVRGIDPELKGAIDRMVFFETELTDNPVYVQAQTILVRRLFYSSGAQIYSDLPGTPDIPDAVVKPLGDATSATTVRDGQRYGVIEQRFAIFPEHSGDLTIPAISVTSSVRVQSNGRTRRSGVRVETDPITVHVLPIPDAYPADQPWLPAQNLTLSDRWNLTRTRIKVGDPIQRTVRARVEGNLSSVIPPLEPALPQANFRRYPEPPDLNDDASGRTLYGVREQTYAIIPTAPGRITLPPTELIWWDVDKRQVRTARAPGRTLQVLGPPAQPPGVPEAPTTASATPPATAPPADTGTDVDVDAGQDQVPWPGAVRRTTWSWVALALAAIAALVLIMRRRRAAPRPAASRPASRRARWRALQRACAGNDDGAIHQALLDYLRTHYHASVTDAVRRFRGDGHGAVIDALNADLYRSGEPRRIDGRMVLDAVRALRRDRRPRGDVLPALYD